MLYEVITLAPQGGDVLVPAAQVDQAVKIDLPVELGDQTVEYVVHKVIFDELLSPSYNFV